MAKSEFRGITKRTKSLWEQGENFDYDLKRDLRGLHGEDLVAFANSPSGGTIFIGVDEAVATDGSQTQIIHGCAIGDETKLTILNKAEDCVPAVELYVYFENMGSDKPFARVEIPSSKIRPHCTAKGIYKIRNDGRNRPLAPVDLLHLFLQLEGEKFIKQFRDATLSLENDLSILSQTMLIRLSDVEDSLEEELSKIKDRIALEIGDIQAQLSDEISQVESSLSSEVGEWGEGQLMESNAEFSNIDRQLEQLGNSLYTLENNTGAVINNLDERIKQNDQLIIEYLEDLSDQLNNAIEKIDGLKSGSK